MSLQDFFPKWIQWNISTLKDIDRQLVKSGRLVKYVWKIQSKVKWFLCFFVLFCFGFYCRTSQSIWYVNVTLWIWFISSIQREYTVCMHVFTYIFTGQQKMQSWKSLYEYFYFLLKTCNQIPLGRGLYLSAFNPAEVIKIISAFPRESL